MAAMILAEVGDFTRFDSPDKLLAYAGMSPSTYQSGQLKNCYPHMEKRGSRYLRYALYNATKYVCLWNPNFADYLAKKRAEGKHYNVALSHASKKLVRLIFAMEKSNSLILVQQYKFTLLACPGVLTNLCFAIPFCEPSVFLLPPSFWGLTPNS